jgi:hypothetical protein
LLAAAPRAFRAGFARTRASATSIDLIDRTKTTGSNLSRDYSVGELMRMWAGNARVRYVEIRQQGLFIVDEKYALRIKKLDSASRSRNVRTKQDQHFRAQVPLPGLSAMYNLELGYVLDETRTEIVDVRLVCLNGRRPYWWQSVEQPSAEMYDLLAALRTSDAPVPTISPRVASVDAPEVDSGIAITPKRR